MRMRLPGEIEKHLLDQRRAALGVVQRLVMPLAVGCSGDPTRLLDDPILSKR